ncbi:hypothetical protein [Paraburkholderia sp. Cy-641]|uniref:hypothetical protein n=1 Tax=Paraburkholderia sp. Cy-641 TaxID=2608337 RepID=UPI001963C70E|nr:hypothetical protein [Paraburkholderia sp. Cy-641]
MHDAPVCYAGTSMTNREKYLVLLQQAGVTQVESAALIARQTQRPCSPRTVRTWLAKPGTPSARPCPGWAIEALERQLENEK